MLRSRDASREGTAPLRAFDTEKPRAPRLKVIDMSPEAMPKRNSVSIRLTKAVSIYLATSFYDEKCIAPDETAIKFRSSVLGEILLRLRNIAKAADFEFIKTMDVTNHEQVSRLRWMLQRYGEHLDMSKIPRAQVKVEINGLPELGSEGDMLSREIMIFEVNRTTVELTWIEGGKTNSLTLVPGREEYLGDTLVRVLEIDKD